MATKIAKMINTEIEVKEKKANIISNINVALAGKNLHKNFLVENTGTTYYKLSGKGDLTITELIRIAQALKVSLAVLVGGK